MGTFTAQILVGSGYLESDGIVHTHSLLLSENSRPAWVLSPRYSCKDLEIVWIPTVETMLEDGLLMIALHLLNDDSLKELCQSYPNLLENRVQLYDAIALENLRTLQNHCRQVSQFPKLIISVFQGSSIMHQLEILKEYQMNVEVCTPAYSRLSSIVFPNEM